MPDEKAEMLRQYHHRSRHARRRPIRLALKHCIQLGAVQRDDRRPVVGHERPDVRPMQPHDFGLEVQQRLAGKRPGKPYHKHPIRQHFKRRAGAVSGDPGQHHYSLSGSRVVGRPQQKHPPPRTQWHPKEGEEQGSSAPGASGHFMGVKMKKIMVLALALAGSAVMAQSHTKSGYVKKDGTYVAPSVATNPDSTKLNNYSTKGNVNPATGKEGTIDPYKIEPYKAPKLK